MNREILFRGQTRRLGEKVRMNGEKLPGKWVYGGIFPGTGDFSVIYGCEESTGSSIENIEKYVVHSDTVGQYTGMTDKNGVKIFEGDIVKTKKYGKISGHMTVNDFDVFEVRYTRCTFRLENKNRGFNLVDDGFSKFEVIGNIHDNPELLKGAGNATSNL